MNTDTGAEQAPEQFDVLSAIAQIFRKRYIQPMSRAEDLLAIMKTCTDDATKKSALKFMLLLRELPEHPDTLLDNRYPTSQQPSGDDKTDMIRHVRHFVVKAGLKHPLDDDDMLEYTTMLLRHFTIMGNRFGLVGQTFWLSCLLAGVTGITRKLPPIKRVLEDAASRILAENPEAFMHLQSIIGARLTTYEAVGYALTLDFPREVLAAIVTYLSVLGSILETEAHHGETRGGVIFVSYPGMEL